MKRVISLWLPRLPTDRLNQATADWRDRIRPAQATVEAVASGQRLAAINAAAQACGLHAGMRLADARAIKPDLHTHPADAKADRRLLERLANWCDRYTPWVALDEADAAAGTSGMALLLDISGCAHLFGAGHDPNGGHNERRLVEDLTRRLADLGFACRAAVADSAGAAWAACRFAETSDALCIAPSGQRAALAGLPVAGLRLTPEIVEGLHRLGLRRIGDLYSVARAPLANRFGALPLLPPAREDHIEAAELRNRCRRAGVQIGTIDALLAQLCIRHKLVLLTTDEDFARAASHCPLRIWGR